ncbi:double-strand break repair protein AddB [Pelagibacterium sp. H642]|uniref:double-strand break repair protein AddB n=1 Tax=Pelagibacterium sp. H642 TaxID=1881069 RepID=UPI002815C7C7|nr:double-strand break repair protein AddB [Pelagibacterium sp. H642]WMT92041.1 double-strand break repair protein AddB [Pelagibacterium sp. H642]
MTRRGNVFTIAPHAPFLDTLARALIDGRIAPDWPRHGAFWLSDMTIYLPTRRAATALSRILAQALSDHPMLLPDIRPLGGEDPAQEPFLPPYEPLDLPPPINRFKRRLLLAELVERWLATRSDGPFSAPGLGGFSGAPNSAEIFALADSLGTLIDDFSIARIDPRSLVAIESDQLPAQWQDHLDFVSFVLEAWPSILLAEGEMEAAERTNVLLERKAQSLAVIHGDRPVVVAGSTGSIPATADLIASIAGLPNGAVVLAGLDTDMVPETLAALDDPSRNPHGHPQYGLSRLLKRLGTPPSTVIELAPSPAPRTEILNAALGLPEATAQWQSVAERLGPAIGEAMEGVALVRARTPEEEARAIALCVHDALETGRSVAIISPDQTLARRICAELARFSVPLDDAAGTPLLLSRAGRLVRQAVSAAAGGLAAVDVMALLRNRNVSLGLGRAKVALASQWLDLAVFRSQRPPPGFDGLRLAVSENLGGAGRPALRLDADKAKAVLALIDALQAALAPITGLLEKDGIFAAQAAEALQAATALLRSVPPGETSPPIEGEDELARWFELAARQGNRGPRLSGEGLPFALEGLLAGQAVRPRQPDAEDVMVFGRLEARLMQADRVILAGMIESVWPEIADPGPWMSRGMRLAVGLEPPEKLHGLAAHDFLMAAGSGEVVFTLPERSGTSPAIPSRLIQRLEAFVGEDIAKGLAARGAVWVENARRLDATGAPPQPAARPAPCPPAAARPRKLSITEAETLLRSPYDLYARHVLGLRRIEALGADPDHAERGTLIHDILGDFIIGGHDPHDTQALGTLMALARERYGRLDAIPARRDIWLARFEVIAHQFLAYERKRTHIAERVAEIRGEVPIPIAKPPFILSGRADRIDRTVSGSLEIIDFKTGQAPQPKDMKQFFAPQLPLEAWMARHGAFGDRLDLPTEAMAYLKLSHGPKALQETLYAAPDGMSLGEAVDTAFGLFQRHVRALLLDDRLPMVARVLPKPNQRYKGDYDHLMRLDEWTVLESEDETE